MVIRQRTRWIVRLLLGWNFAVIYNFSFAQEIPQSGYPQGYFRDPLDLPIHLAGNFGELRPGHFHMGLDIKTNGRIGFPVYAAADGYISRVKIESSGFGNAIYIDHPNGYTTVYVHLDHFTPELAAYVKAQQYKLERWEVLLDIPPGNFPVRKGQLIAYSGNTGGSMAPHLHFEIRDTRTDENRNPALFGLPLADATPPSLLRLGVYDAGISSYLQVPRILPLVRSGSGYSVPGGGVATYASDVRLAIGAVDRQTGSANALGIYSATVFKDGKPVSGFTLDKFGYQQTRYVNAHTDYSLKTGGGPSVEFLTPLPGDALPVYRSFDGDGSVHLDDEAPHNIRIEVRDALGNLSVAAFTLRRSGPAPDVDQGDLFQPNQVNVFENGEFLLYLPEHALYDAVRPVFQHSVLSGAYRQLPDSSAPAILPTLRELPADPGTVAMSPVYGVLSSLIPVQDSFTVSIHARVLDDTHVPPTSSLAPFFNPESDRSGKYVIVVHGPGSSRHVARVTWAKGWASAKLKDLGLFRLVRDETPPDIQPLDFRDGAVVHGALRVRVTDNLGELRGVRAELDGKWLMFSYKGDVYTYVLDEHFPPGRHVLTVSAEDEAGNVIQKNYNLTR